MDGRERRQRGDIRDHFVLGLSYVAGLTRLVSKAFLPTVMPSEPRALSVERSTSPCGASFRLAQPSRLTHTEVLADGWIAELVSGSQQVVVRGSRPISQYEVALDEAHTASQLALDVLTMRGLADLVTQARDIGHIVWWTSGASLFTRVVGVTDFGVSMSATATMAVEHGTQVQPPAPPPLPWHPSLRYLRLAQTTSDLFDAYRNMYLALESLLSTAVPPLPAAGGKRPEGEGAWLKRALRTVDAALPLLRYAPPGSKDAVSALIDDLYVGTRTRLFHAKSGRPVLLPHTGRTRAAVTESLMRISQLFLDLFHHYFGFVYPSGGLTFAGFALATGFDTEAVVSDDPAPSSDSDTVINPSGGSACRLPTRQAPELSRPGLRFWLAEQVGDQLRVAGPLVRRAGLEHEGALLQVDRLDDPLSLEGVDVLQVQLGLRLVNRQTPRFSFLT